MSLFRCLFAQGLPTESFDETLVLRRGGWWLVELRINSIKLESASFGAPRVGGNSRIRRLCRLVCVFFDVFREWWWMVCLRKLLGREYLRSEKRLVVRILWDHSTAFIPNATGMIVNPCTNQDFMRCSFRHLILVKLSPCRICWANSCAQNELDLAKKQFDLCDEDGSGGCRTCRWKVMSNRGSRWLGWPTTQILSEYNN